MRIFFYWVLVAFSNTVAAQVNLAAVQKNIEKHVAYLASDSLEGRRAGTAGELKAMNYISRQFASNGLQPKGANGFYQAFDIYDGKDMAAETKLILQNRELKKHTEYFLLPYSADTTISTAVEWVLLDSILTLAKNNPHFDVQNAMYEKAKALQEAGASAVFFTNSSGFENPRFESKSRLPQLKIPVVYLADQLSDVKKSSTALHATLTTRLADKKRTGHNVIGYIDNNAAHTVVLGAHYDHLGYGEDGNSTFRGEGKHIHNGADDNASGTATLIELSRLLKTSTAKNNNYLFIAFSAEELGLFGSKYFVENPTIPLNNINYMINMDMVGRLNDSSQTLTIGGFGTSLQWANVIKGNESLRIKTDSSGAGPSDHASFYRKDIPVLFYFTGLHTDYHKPSDDFDKINYKGAALITQHIHELIKALDAIPKLTFLKTREMQVVNTSFRVTLGIMPDYTFSGSGVKADGISDGRPAANAGLKAGDIITRIGDIEITDINAYMKALGAFNKGQTTTIRYKRGNEEKETSLTF